MEPIHYICVTCGCQYEASAAPPESCLICSDDRQYIGAGGQRWTTLAAVNAAHRNVFELVAPSVYALYSTPAFGINQRAHLLQTDSGNVLWDCITNLDASTLSLLQQLGGIRAIALSHPHYYSTIVEWARAFNAPVYINRKDSGFLTRRGPELRFWEGSERVDEELTLVECGGHFPGASVLHWSRGAGALFAGDTIQVTPTRRTVSFMYSYPNMIPLPKRAVEGICAAVAPYAFDDLYGAFGLYVRGDAKEAVLRSAERYLQIFDKG
ncbi:MBL fold metallo-hydrolase [Flaviaesturariibacter terrae]